MSLCEDFGEMRTYIVSYYFREELIVCLSVNIFSIFYKMHYSEIVKIYKLEAFNDLDKQYFEYVMKHNNTWHILDFYASIVLKLLVSDIAADIFGINSDPNRLTKFSQRFVNNNELLIINNKLYPPKKTQEFLLKRIIGILYYQYGIYKLDKISKWWRNLPPVMNIILKFKNIHPSPIPDIIPSLESIQVAEILNFEEYFEDVDFGLIRLSLTRNENNSFLGINKGSRNNQVLEFYGDSVFNFLMMNYIRNNYGLSSAGSLYGNLTNNSFLTNLSIKLKICFEILNAHKNDLLEKHNACADSMEALIGALWFQYGTQNMFSIDDWFNSLPEISSSIKEILNQARKTEDEKLFEFEEYKVPLVIIKYLENSEEEIIINHKIIYKGKSPENEEEWNQQKELIYSIY